MGRRRWQLVGSPTSPTSPTGPTSPTSPRRRCHAGREQSYTPPIPPACFGGLPSDGMEQFAGDDDDDCSVRTLSTLHDFWALVRKKRDARVCVCAGACACTVIGHRRRTLSPWRQRRAACWLAIRHIRDAMTSRVEGETKSAGGASLCSPPRSFYETRTGRERAHDFAAAIPADVRVVSTIDHNMMYWRFCDFTFRRSFHRVALAGRGLGCVHGVARLRTLAYATRRYLRSVRVPFGRGARRAADRGRRVPVSHRWRGWWHRTTRLKRSRTGTRQTRRAHGLRVQVQEKGGSAECCESRDVKSNLRRDHVHAPRDDARCDAWRTIIGSVDVILADASRRVSIFAFRDSW